MTVPCAAMFPEVEKLQFGHGGDAVDDYCSIRDSEALTSFNSATAVTPWRTRKAPSLRRTVSVLQFGHGGDAVENEACEGHKMHRIKLQFGHGGDAVDNSQANREAR